MKYYLLHDNNVQWFTKLCSIDDDNNIIEFINVDTNIKGQFIDSIIQREMHFSNRSYLGDSYYGWTISQYEFQRLKKLIELYPKYQEYLNLL